jgi:hypothetical protein
MQPSLPALLVLALALCALPVDATAQPTLSVSPRATAVSAFGETFTVEVTLADYSDLRGFSVGVLYNQAAVRHVSVAQGDVFTRDGGPGGIFLSSGSDPEQGYVLAEGARIGGGGSSGQGAVLFRLVFQSVGPGATDLAFAHVHLRDPSNDPIPSLRGPGLVAVVSPLPDALYTRTYGPVEADTTKVAFGSTGLVGRVRVVGSALRGKVTAARYDEPPPGGAASPFADPEGPLDPPDVAEAYWEVTSSLAGAYALDLGFSYAGLSGPSHPSGYRVAVRPLGAEASDGWTLIPAAVTRVDERARVVYVEGAPGAGQYALVFGRAASTSETFSEVPSALTLDAVYPDPFRERAVVRYRLAREGRVHLAVYDALGRPVAVLVDDYRAGGLHEEAWAPGGLSAGAYVVRLRSGGEVRSRLVRRVRL